MTDRISLDYRHAALSTAVLILAVTATAISGLARRQGTDGAAGPTPKAEITKAIGFALQGDAMAATSSLLDIPAERFQGEDATLRECMVNRFAGEAGPRMDLDIHDTWVASLANLYVTYWQHALMHPSERAVAENELAVGVGPLVNHSLHVSSDLDSVEDEIQAEVRKRGFYVLLGRTTPLREFMLWKKQTSEDRTVNLPERPYVVHVTYLDEFLFRGWGYYATCGRRSTGGWADEHGLFAVVPSYKSLTDETFSVRFLAHETQHFADRQAFKELEPWELEYRAKLVELTLAHESQQSTLQLICENKAKDKASAHAYANSKIVSELDSRLHIEVCNQSGGHEEVIRDGAAGCCWRTRNLAMGRPRRCCERCGRFNGVGLAMMWFACRCRFAGNDDSLRRHRLDLNSLIEVRSIYGYRLGHSDDHRGGSASCVCSFAEPGKESAAGAVRCRKGVPPGLWSEVVAFDRDCSGNCWYRGNICMEDAMVGELFVWRLRVVECPWLAIDDHAFRARFAA